MFLAACSEKTDAINTSFEDETVRDVTKYEIQFPSSMDNLSSASTLGIGSGLQFKEKTPDGNLLFYSITDRGPNFSINNLKFGSEEFSGLVFLDPNFTPFISLIKVIPKVSANVIDYRFVTKHYQSAAGIMEHSALEANPLTASLKPVPHPSFGPDTEGIAIDKDGNFWIGDEYGPSIIYADRNGSAIKTYTPGNGLPEILRHAILNRGIESISIAPNGKVYAILESMLKINKDNARFARMLELDPVTDKVRMFAYPLSGDSSVIIAKTKISDLATISDTIFLVAEQNTNSEKQMTHNIYKIDIKDVTDISDMKLPSGKELEYGNLLDLQNIRMVKKELFMNAEKYGWRHEKLEGLAIVDDHTIAITNDSDFGVSEIKVNKHCYKKDCAVIESVADKLDEHTYLWIFNLHKSLLG